MFTLAKDQRVQSRSNSLPDRPSTAQVSANETRFCKEFILSSSGDTLGVSTAWDG